MIRNFTLVVNNIHLMRLILHPLHLCHSVTITLQPFEICTGQQTPKNKPDRTVDCKDGYRPRKSTSMSEFDCALFTLQPFEICTGQTPKIKPKYRPRKPISMSKFDCGDCVVFIGGLVVGCKLARIGMIGHSQR